MKKPAKHSIMIVDDETAIRNSLASLLSTYGFETHTLASVEAMLNALQVSHPSCILLDVRMPGIDGLQAQKLLAEQDVSPPVIMMSGHGDIAMAVAAIKHGASDFIEKPIDDEKLVAAIELAIEKHSQKAGVAQRYASLSPREKVIAGLVAKGYSTLAIAAELGISNRTVDHHRANLSAKMQATSLPQLMGFLFELNLHVD
jgi:two-component system, LuxR family, response regulator FixJ